MVEQKEEQVLAIIDRGTFKNPDTGYALAIASRQQDGRYRAATSAEFPNRGEIRIREGVANILERGSRVVLANVREDVGYEPEDNRSCAWICLYRREMQELNRWDFCEVISGDERMLRDRVAELPFRPLDIIFIEDRESHVLYGPLLVTRFASSEDEDSWRRQQYAFEPVSTSALPKTFSEFLADEQYATLRIPISVDLEERIIGSEGDAGARRLLDTTGLNLRAVQSEIIDLATDRELERWMGKAIKQVVEAPAEHLESLRSVQNLLAARNDLGGQLWKSRVKRLSALEKLSVLDGSVINAPSAASPAAMTPEDIDLYVQTNFDELVKKSARAKDFSKKIEEKQNELKDLEKTIRDALDQRKKQIRFNENAKTQGDKLKDQVKTLEVRLESINDEISQEIDRIKEDNTEELGALSLELEQARSDLTAQTLEVEKAIQEKSRLASEKTIIEAEILRTKNNYTADLIKHASLSDALAGRKPSTPTVPYVETNFAERDTASGKEIRFEIFEAAGVALREGGRELDEFDVACLLTSVVQNFLVVFYGEPGSGKTSLGRILSQFLSSGIEHRKKFIQVQRGWSRGEEILGFQNVLKSTRENDPFGLFRSLEYFNRYSNHTFDKELLIAVLDEANLSPLEHYWSDFIGVSDEFFNAPGLIEVPETGLEGQHSGSISVPPGMRFLATINTDNTTEMLSDRMLSRACFLRLSAAEELILQNVSNLSSQGIDIPLHHIHQAFYLTSELPEISNQSALQELIEGHKILRLSVRKQVAMARFMAVVEEVCTEQGLNQNKALDQALCRFVLPTLRGQQQEYSRRLSDLEEELRARQLNSSAALVAEILEVGKRNGAFFEGLWAT